MARTERRQWSWEYSNGNTFCRLDPNGRDAKGQCWCCSGWKRPARRKVRHDAKAALRRDML